MGLFLFVSALPSSSQEREAINGMRILNWNVETIHPLLYDMDRAVRLSCISVQPTEHILVSGFEAVILGKQSQSEIQSEECWKYACGNCVWNK